MEVKLSEKLNSSAFVSFKVIHAVFAVRFEVNT